MTPEEYILSPEMIPQYKRVRSLIEFLRASGFPDNATALKRLLYADAYNARPETAVKGLSFDQRIFLEGLNATVVGIPFLEKYVKVLR